MIKFFRKIRQRILTKNKFSQYLIYAIGEVILVVIGILIALTINNWNEEWKIRKEESLVLQNLKEDFEFNLTSIVDLISNTSKEIQIGLTILDNTGIRYQSSSDFDLDSYLIPVANHKIYFAQNGFLNDLISSGKLGIIENDSLRVALSSWVQIGEELYRQEQAALHHITLLIDYIKKYGSWLNVDYLYPQWGINFPKSGFDINNNTLLEQLEFENLIDEVVNRKGGLRVKQNKVWALNSEILKLIHFELEN